MTGAPPRRGSYGTVVARYEVEGALGADWLGVDGAEAPLADAVFDWLFVAGCRPRKPMALPFGCPRLRRVRRPDMLIPPGVRIFPLPIPTHQVSNSWLTGQ